MVAKQNTTQGKTAEKDIAEQFEEVSKKLQSIRNEAADALPGLRSTLQSTLDKYNSLVGISDSGAARLKIVEETAGTSVDSDEEPPVGYAHDHDTASPSSEPEPGPKRSARNPKPVRRVGSADEKPLDPNDIKLSDPDGVVVPDYKTEEGGDSEKANGEDDGDSLGFLGGDDDA